MAYIGNQPKSATFAIDSFNGNGVTVNFTLRDSPVSTSSILVFVGGVRQATDTYSLSGTTLTFSEAPPTGTNNIQVLFLGLGASPTVPSDSSVTTLKLVDNSVTNTKIADAAVTSSKLDANITITSNLTVGNIIASGIVTATDFNSTSDVALKDNLTIITDPISTINKLNGFSFNWKKDGKKSYGLTAQEVEKVLPEIVQTREDGYKGINYLNIIAFLVESVKDLQKQIDDLKK